MPNERLSRFILLPELELLATVRETKSSGRLECQKAPLTEYCPKCASPSRSTYDHRWVRIKDAPIRGQGMALRIRKRRLWCKPCQKPFTEPIAGIRKGKRHTERYARSVLWACENFSDLSQVRRAYNCSADFLYKTYYQKLRERVKERINYAWTRTIGIDEHAFKKARSMAPTEFVTMIVDYDNKRVRELVYGKTAAALSLELASIPGRENVQNVVLDLCDPFKNFAREYFPQARIIADKFHVLRLLTPALLRRRKEITGTRADLRAKKLLLMSGHKLGYAKRHTLMSYLAHHPELKELYEWKERLHRFYRIRDYLKAHLNPRIEF